MKYRYETPAEISISEMQLNTSCGSFYPATNLSFGDWIRVTAALSSGGLIQNAPDSILLLILVPPVRYELRLIPSCD